jgi:hypothetical protein
LKSHAIEINCPYIAYIHVNPPSLSNCLKSFVCAGIIVCGHMCPVLP